MKLAFRSPKFDSLKFIVGISLMALAFQITPISGTEENDSTNSADTSNQTHEKKRTIPKDITKQCGKYCQNLVVCQKNEELNAKCFAHCPKSGCVRRGKKPTAHTTLPPDNPSPAQKSDYK